MPFTETTTINVILSTIILKFLEPAMGSGPEKLGNASVASGGRTCGRLEIQAGYVFVCCGDRIQEYSSSLRCTPLRSFLLSPFHSSLFMRGEEPEWRAALACGARLASVPVRGETDRDEGVGGADDEGVGGADEEGELLGDDAPDDDAELGMAERKGSDDE